MVNYIFYRENGQGQRYMAARPVRSRKDYLALRGSEQNRRQVAQVRRLIQRGAPDAEIKAAKFRLLKLAYNDLMPDGKVRGATHPAATFFHDIDLEDPGHQSEDIVRRVLTMREELGLLMLERSVSGGLHLVCRRQPGRTVLENQVRVAMLLHTEMDTNNSNLERIVLTTGTEDLLYLDDELFADATTVEQSEQEMATLLLREENGLEEVPPGAKKANKHYRPWEEVGAAATAPAEGNSEAQASAEGNSEAQAPAEGNSEATAQAREAVGTTSAGEAAAASYRGIPYTRIIDEYWRRTGGRPVDGERNVKLYQLAVNLRAICDNDQALLLRVMPRMGISEQEMHQIVASACKEVPKGISKLVKQIVGEAAGTATKDEAPASEAETEEQQQTGGEQTASALPALPSRLSPLMALYAEADLDECFRPAVLMNVFAALATHLRDVRFTDNATLAVEPTQICLLMAPPQAGKSCINAPIEATNADIQARDNAVRAQMEAWSTHIQQLGSNTEKPAEPKWPIQICMHDMTSAALIKRLTAAQPSFLFTKMDEIELLRGVQARGGRGTATELLRLAYDTASYGAERATAQGFSGKVPLRWNLSISTTMQNGRSFLDARAAYDGTLSRITLSTIHRGLSARRPHFGNYGEAFRQQLQPYMQRLTEAQGSYKCPEAIELMDDLRQEIVDHITLTDDQVALAMYERGIVNAFKRAMILYLAEGAWSPEIGDFARWSFYYDLECKRLIFGDLIDKGMKGEKRVQRTTPGPRNLLEQLAETFSQEDLIRVRTEAGLDANTKQMVSNWKHRGYIVEVRPYLFHKVPRDAE